MCSPSPLTAYSTMLPLLCDSIFFAAPAPPRCLFTAASAQLTSSASPTPLNETASRTLLSSPWVTAKATSWMDSITSSWQPLRAAASRSRVSPSFSSRRRSCLKVSLERSADTLTCPASAMFWGRSGRRVVQARESPPTFTTRLPPAVALPAPAFLVSARAPLARTLSTRTVDTTRIALFMDTPNASDAGGVPPIYARLLPSRLQPRKLPPPKRKLPAFGERTSIIARPDVHAPHRREVPYRRADRRGWPGRGLPRRGSGRRRGARAQGDAACLRPRQPARRS